MAGEGYHEPPEALSPEAKDMHRAIQSMIEELQAITWYSQRIEASDDSSLQELLAHNRDEEREHASMLLEWIRRRDPEFDPHLRTYLFTEAPITDVEAAATAAGGDVTAGGTQKPATASAGGHATVGSLLGRR